MDSNQPILEDLDDKSFDPFAMEGRAFGEVVNPWDKVQKLARENWFHPHSLRSVFVDNENAALADRKFVMFMGHEKCLHALSSPELYSNEVHAQAFGISFGTFIGGMDAPEHPRYRKIFQRAFLPNIVRHWSDNYVDPVVSSLIDGFKDRGKADLVEEFTKHYPFQVIYRQLGLPSHETKLFHKMAVAQITHYYAPAIAAEAGRKLGAYFTAMVRARRESPGEDLPSILATAEADGERLPEAVVLGFLRQLVAAGGDTTYRGTSNLLTGLLTHPDQLEQVRADRSLVPAAIEEALRWEGPVMATQRTLVNDTEFDGKLYKKGTVIDICVGSANHDERVYDEPGRFDIHRKPGNVRNLAFGSGPHVCIGQHLARLEMTRALNAILDRLPNLRLDPDYPPPQIQGFSMRAPKHIFVRFG